MSPYLIVGAGAVANLVRPLLPNRSLVFALCRQPEAMALWRARGTIPIQGDLDDQTSLQRLPGLAQTILYFAPPNHDGTQDRHTRHLIAALRHGKILPQHLIYISTTGVYGPCDGAWLDETSPIHPDTARAKRRAHAEQQLRQFGRESNCRVMILRAPGIYDAQRLPLERLRRQDPLPQENPWTNHIHSSDLAGTVMAALRRGKSQRLYNAVDDEPLTVLQFYGYLAQHFHLPVPETLPYEQLKDRISPMSLSFLKESRRIHNQRITHELNLLWHYPSVRYFLEQQ